MPEEIVSACVCGVIYGTLKKEIMDVYKQASFIRR